MVVVAFYWHFEEGDIFCDLEEVFLLQQSQLICFNLKPPSWQYFCVLLKEIFFFFHWTQRTGVSPVCREGSFLAVISENAAIPHFLRKSQKFEIDGYGRTVWISLHLLRTKDCNTIITDFSTLISILMKDEQGPKKNLIFPRPST